METCHFSLFSWHILFIVFGFQHSDKNKSHGLGLLPPAISFPFVASVFNCGQSCHGPSLKVESGLDCCALETSAQSLQALLTLLIIGKGMSQQAVLTSGEMGLVQSGLFHPPPQLLPLIPPVPKMSRGEMFCSLKTEIPFTITHQESRGALHRNQVIALEYLRLWIRSSISIYLLVWCAGFGMVDHGRTGFLRCTIFLGSGRTNRRVLAPCVVICNSFESHTGEVYRRREDQNSFSNPQIAQGLYILPNL